MSNVLVGRAVVAAAVLAIAAPSLAQQALSSDEAEAELAGYADCVVSRKSFREPVDVFLRTIPDGEDFGAAGLKAADMTCLNSAAVRRRAAKMEMKLQPITFRQALYPALYRRDFGKKGPPSSIADVQPLSLATEFSGEVTALPNEYQPLRALGDCVGRRDPQAAHAILLAKPHSRKDDAAFKALGPVLQACVFEGQTLHFTRGVLRAYIGEAMYKLARAAERSSS